MTDIPTIRPPLDHREFRVVPIRHYGRWAWAIVMLSISGLLLNSIVNNPRFEWSVVQQYLTQEAILSGVRVTIELTLYSVVFGFLGGAILAVMRISSNPVLSTVSWIYTWLFRATPILVQLFLWYNIAALYPEVSITLPGIGTVWQANTNTVISPYGSALLALVLHQAAYASEIIRAGILSVDRGQWEAARAIGFTGFRTLTKIVLPQAMRTILPPAGNEVIGQLKTTAVVSVIALQDLLYSAQVIYQRTYEVIPLLIVASLWYIAMTSLLSIGQYFVESHFGRGTQSHRVTGQWMRGFRTIRRQQHG